MSNRILRALHRTRSTFTRPPTAADEEDPQDEDSVVMAGPSRERTEPEIVHRAGHHFPRVTVDGTGVAHLGDINIYGSTVADVQAKAEKQRSDLLLSLAYEDMNARRAQLAQRSAQFVEWIWKGQHSDTDASFVDWLGSKDTSFWITGKPGSGKSTLMKYIQDDGRCVELLARKSGRKWISINFYFDFRSHSALANSLEGLLRSLLFQLAEADPTAETAIRERRLGRVVVIKEDLDMGELRRLFKQATGAVQMRHSICAFVDGLDEFNGSFTDAIELLEYITSNGVDKVCVACRPEHVLWQYFSQKSFLRMEDYNVSTIRAYVDQSLRKWAGTVDTDVGLDNLISSVVKSAEGVILWAQLVTNLLVHAILAGETEEELRCKLLEFPKELNEAYARLLSGVRPAWRFESAVMLHLIRSGLPELRPRDLQCALIFLKETGRLPGWPHEIVRADAFLLRIRSRTGSMVDIVGPPGCLKPGAAEEMFLDIRIRLFHRTLDTYLETSGWVHEQLSSMSPPIEPERLWLRLCCECIEQYEISERTHQAVWDRLSDYPAWQSFQAQAFDRIFERDLFDDRREWLTFRAVLALETLHSGACFLAYAIATLFEHITGSSVDLQSSGIDLQQVLGSRIMSFHWVLARGPSLHPDSYDCECAIRIPRLTGSYHPSFTVRDTVQRAQIFALSHDLLDMTVQIGGDHSLVLGDIDESELQHLLFEQSLKPLSQPKQDSVLALLRNSGLVVDESHVAQFVQLSSQFSSRVLQEMSDHLRRRPWTRFLMQPFNGVCYPDTISQHGYNLLLLWSWYLPLAEVHIWGQQSMIEGANSKQYYDHEDLWARNGVMDDKLKILLESGLDINKKCSIFGPPLHSVIEISLILHQRHEKRKPAIPQLRCLLRHGARRDTVGPLGTPLRTAYHLMEALKNDSYTPLKCMPRHSKQTGLSLLEEITHFLGDFEQG